MLADLHGYTVDAATILKDAGAITSSAAAQVGGSNRILDLSLGASVTNSAGMQPAAQVSGLVIVDVTALTLTADNIDRVIVQVSSSASFASDIMNVAILDLSQASNQLGGADVVGAVGRYVIPFQNWDKGVTRRYLRAYTQVGGTSPSINYTAFVAPNQVP